MTGTTLDDATRAGLDLYQGERVLWAKVQRGKVKRKTPKLGQNWPWEVQILPMIIILVAYAGGGRSNLLRDVAIMLSILAVISILVRIGPLKGLDEAFARPAVRVFMSCVVTDRRILLFDSPGNPVTSLQRSRMAKVKQDFAEGAPALMFRTDHPRRDYAFISTTDFTPALRVLKS